MANKYILAALLAAGIASAQAETLTRPGADSGDRPAVRVLADVKTKAASVNQFGANARGEPVVIISQPKMLLNYETTDGIRYETAISADVAEVDKAGPMLLKGNATIRAGALQFSGAQIWHDPATGQMIVDGALTVSQLVPGLVVDLGKNYSDIFKPTPSPGWASFECKGGSLYAGTRQLGSSITLRSATTCYDQFWTFSCDNDRVMVQMEERWNGCGIGGR